MLPILLAVAFAAAPKPTQLVIKVKPAQVVIYLDGRKLGTAAKEYTLNLQPGEHTVRTTLKGDSSEKVIRVKKGERHVFNFDMTDSGDPSQKPKAEEPPPSEPAAPGPPADSPPERDPDLPPEK
jgi:hypothetical protein